MKHLRSLCDRVRAARTEESGFTMVELIIAIPVTILLLGTVVASIGVAVGLQSQVSAKVAASRAANSFVNQMNSVRNCQELNYLIRNKAADTSGKYIATFGSYNYNATSCTNGRQLNIPFTLKTASDGRIYYSQTISVAMV